MTSVHQLGGECKISKPRTCELEITLGEAQIAAAAAGVSSGEIDALEGRPFTVDEAREAAQAVAARLPAGDDKTEVLETIDACFYTARGKLRRN